MTFYYYFIMTSLRQNYYQIVTATVKYEVLAGKARLRHAVITHFNCGLCSTTLKMNTPSVR